MKIKSILSVILCISIALGLMPFMNGRVNSATDAPKDIYGNENGLNHCLPTGKTAARNSAKKIELFLFITVFNHTAVL